MKARDFIYYSAKIKEEGGTQNFINFSNSFFDDLKLLSTFKRQIAALDRIFLDIEVTPYRNGHDNSVELIADFDVLQHWYVITNQKINGEYMWTIQENHESGDITYIKDQVSFRSIIATIRQIIK